MNTSSLSAIPGWVWLAAAGVGLWAYSQRQHAAPPVTLPLFPMQPTHPTETDVSTRTIEDEILAYETGASNSSRAPSWQAFDRDMASVLEHLALQGTLISPARNEPQGYQVPAGVTSAYTPRTLLGGSYV